MVKRIITGACWGLALGCLFSLWAVLVVAVTDNNQLKENEITLLEVIAAYLGGGAAAGIMVGILQPLVQWILGAAVVGIIAAVPVAVGFRFAVEGFAPWTGRDTAVVAIMAVSLGALTGVVLRQVHFRLSESGNASSDNAR